MKDIDLLPAEYAAREARRAGLVRWAAAVAATVAISAVACVWMATRLTNAQGKLVRLSGEYHMMQRTQSGIEELKTHLATVIDRNQAIMSLLGQRSWCDILADLALRLHGRAWLHGLELNRTITAPSRIGAMIKGEFVEVDSLVLEGFAVTYLELSELMTELNRSASVASVTLETSQAVIDQGRPAVRFGIRVSLRDRAETG